MTPSPEQIARTYFDALSRHDGAAMSELLAPDGVENVAGVAELRGADAIREYWSGVFAAMPDWGFEVLDTFAEAERVAVHWRVTATHTGEAYQGVEAAGARIDATGLDILVVRDGRIARLDAYPDGMTVARQLGLLPGAGSAAEASLTRAFNAASRAARRAATSELEAVAAGVWLLRGGVPRTMNVYLIEDEGGGVTLFDAGIRTMTHAIATAAAPLGGINRVVLGHADADHRGAAAGLGAPVFCHPADREAAEGDDALRAYHRIELLGLPARWVYPSLLRFWDGGAVPIAGTIEEGEDVSGFRVVHLPGHAPGLIGLFRDRDRLALTTDCFYVIDPETSRKVPPGLPHEAFNHDTEQARESMRKLAALDPAAAWPGHADPLTGDVRAQLERGAGA
jgi:hydroxyacylglutathione hydrolase